MILVPAQDGDGEGDHDVFDDQQQQQQEEEEMDQIVDEPQPKKENSIRKYAAERQKKLLIIVLKIAQYGGYDTDGRIKSKDGSFLASSDIIPLLLHALSPGRNLHGLDEFIDLLYRAGVNPEDIINTNVRELLRMRMKRGNKVQTKHGTAAKTSVKPSLKPQLHPAVQPSLQPEPQPERRSFTQPVYSLDNDRGTIFREKKRMREDIEEFEPAAKKSRWETTASDDDES